VIVNPPFAFTGMIENPGAAVVVWGALYGVTDVGAAGGATVGTAGAAVGAGGGEALTVVCGAGGSTMAWAVLGSGTVTLATVVEAAAAGVVMGVVGAFAWVVGATRPSGLATVVYAAGRGAAAVPASGLGTMVVWKVVGTATPVKLRRVATSGAEAVGVVAAGGEATGPDTTEASTWVTVLAVAVGV